MTRDKLIEHQRERIAELEAESSEWSPVMQRLGDENQQLRAELATAKATNDDLGFALSHSEALAGYAVRDARIVELEGHLLIERNDYETLMLDAGRLASELAAIKAQCVDLVFAGELPNAVFVEAEDGNGKSINAGKWFKREDGYWVLRLNSAVAETQEPADGVLLDDCEECSHPEFGRGYFFTDDCVRPLYAAPAAKQVTMPERMQVEPFTTINRDSKDYKAGWNGHANEWVRLNAAPAPEDSQ